MASLLRMPAISANMAEAVLNEWPLAESSAFAAGDPIATVETDKAVVDVPAESDGVLVRTLLEPGKAVSVGTPMAVLAAPGEVIDDIDALVARLTGTEPEPGTDTGTGSSPLPADVAADPPSTTGDVGPIRVFASPLARRLARENGLSVADIDGTGPGGRIVRDDVRRALADRGATAVTPSTTPAAPMSTAGIHPAPTGPTSTSGPAAAGTPATGSATAAPAAIAAPAATGAAMPAALARPGGTTPSTGPSPEAAPAARGDGTPAYEVVPHSRMRRAIASRLADSARETPVFTIRGSARVDDLLRLRAQLNESADVKISVNDLIVAAAARAHMAVPDMNVIWTADAVHRFRDVDVAVAVATDNGLVTPVIRRASELTVSALARASTDVVARARQGRLRQDELEGGTLTVTNLGVFGTEEFTAVINPPQPAILAVGAAREEAVVADGKVTAATVLRVTLSVDHRPVDGALAARWMAHFLGLLEAPIRILA
jgi:pyruvate dehydrogenase E2 component (dihydrolipoamide acetyltransferase)